jgi:CRISPR type IV-associated protein Csf3
MLVRHGTVHLDALLMDVVAKRRRLPRPQTPAELVHIDIPIAMSDCGRHYLASASVYEAAAHEVKYVQRRFPTKEAVHLAGPKLKRIDDGAGAQKSFRIPRERVLPSHGIVRWWCVGDRDAVFDLLGDVTHVGGRRGVGEGMLALRGERWRVERLESLWPGFPVLNRAGNAVRNLPLDTPGLQGHVQRLERLRPPYWMRHEEEWIATPEVGS